MMLGKVYNTLALVSLAVVLAAGGFAGYLFGSGKLNAESAELIAQVLRGEAGAGPAPATQPAVEPDGDAGGTFSGHSAEEVRQARERQQIRAFNAERAAADADARRLLANQALQELINRQEQFDAGKKAWLEQQRKLTAASQDAGFEHELKLVSKLSPALAKEHVVRTWKTQKIDAVRLLKEMDISKTTRILEQFQSPEEIEIAHELLEQLRNQDIDGNVPQSGRTTGDAAP